MQFRVQGHENLTPWAQEPPTRQDQQIATGISLRADSCRTVQFGGTSLAKPWPWQAAACHGAPAEVRKTKPDFRVTEPRLVTVRPSKRVCGVSSHVDVRPRGSYVSAWHSRSSTPHVSLEGMPRLLQALNLNHLRSQNPLNPETKP